MELIATGTLHILQSYPFLLGLLFGVLPLAALLAGKLFRKNFAGWSIRIRIAVAWSVALALAVPASSLSNLPTDYFCGCPGGAFNDLLMQEFRDGFLYTVVFGSILSLASALSGSRPALSLWIVGAFFPLVVAGCSAKQLWNCLQITKTEEHVYQAWSAINAKRPVDLDAKLNAIFAELEKPGGYPPKLSGCRLTAHWNSNIDETIVGIIAAMYLPNDENRSSQYFNRLLALNKGSDLKTIESLKFALAFNLASKQKYRQALPFLEEVIANYDLSKMQEDDIHNNGVLSQSIEYAVESYTELGQIEKGKQLLNQLLSRYERGVTKETYNKNRYRTMLADLLAASPADSSVAPKADDLTKAEMLLTQNVEQFKKQNYDYMIHQSMFKLGDFYLASKQAEKAVTTFQELTKRIRDSLEKAHAPHDANYLWDLRKAMLSLSKSYEDAGNLKSAEKTYQETLDEVKLCHRTNQYEEVSVYEQYVPLLERLGRTDQAISMRRKGIEIATGGRFYTKLRE